MQNNREIKFNNGLYQIQSYKTHFKIIIWFSSWVFGIFY